MLQVRECVRFAGSGGCCRSRVRAGSESGAQQSPKSHFKCYQTRLQVRSAVVLETARLVGEQREEEFR